MSGGKAVGLSAYSDPVLDGKATIVLSHSVGFQDRVANPVAQRLEQHGFRAVRVGEEPLPPHVESSPSRKVEWFFRHADMAVFLATPDDRLESGEVYTRPNIIDEHRLGQELPHLRHRLLVFKAAEVKLPSNINPVYEQLPLDDPEWIVGKIVEQARTWGVLPAAATHDRNAAPESSDEGTSSPALPAGDDTKATGEAIAAISHALDALGGADPDRRRLRRAELSLAGLNADAGSADTLGVHLANSLFARRHHIHPRRGELLLLLRTYLRHVRDDNVPGVFWIKDLSRRQVVELLSSVAQEDGDAEVRAQALKMLGRLGAPSSADEARRLVAPLLGHDESTLRWAAQDFVAKRRDTRLRDVLDDPKLLERDRHRVSQTLALLDLPRRPSEVMERYVEDAYVRSPHVERALLGAARRVRREVVIRALSSSVQEVRLLGIHMAGEKRMMSLSLGRELIERDRSPRVRVAAVRSLLAADEPADLQLLERATGKRDDDLTEFTGFDEVRTLTRDICIRLPKENLKSGVRWDSVHGPACYEALGVRDEQWAEKHVRRDLRSDFTALKDAAREVMLASAIAGVEGNTKRALTEREHEFVIETVNKHWQELTAEEKLGRFLTRQFQRAALRVLVARGRPADVKFARNFASSDDQDLRAEALHLFERFGTSHDAATVLRLVDQLYGDEHRGRAAATALRLAYKKDKLEVLRTLRENHTVRTWSIERLADVDGGLDEAWELLRSDDAEVRLAAANVIWDAVDPERADALLSFYMTGQHFYNVVRAIDRRLYSPDWLGSALHG